MAQYATRMANFIHFFPASLKVNLQFMNRLLSYLLVFAALAQAFQSGLVLAAFHLNKQFIASEQCQFKGVDNNSCQGCCVLKKNLKQAEDQQDDKKSSCLYQQHELQPLQIPGEKNFLGPVYAQKLAWAFCLDIPLLSGVNQRIFQPPRA